LFAQGPDQATTRLIGRIKSAIYTSNGTPVFNLVPCVRIFDDKPGMYDIVRRQFITNAGTGKFVIPT
jgi:hypothetical protein